VNFTGYRHDDETSLEYAMARYYNAGQGRFSSFDPITENDQRLVMPQGMTFYPYVQNNPLTYIDPTGKQRADDVKNSERFGAAVDKYRKEHTRRWVHNNEGDIFENTAQPVNPNQSEIERNKLYRIYENAAGDYSDLAGWLVVIQATKQGRSAFQKVRPTDPASPQLDRPDIGQVDFYLINEEKGSIERTQGYPEGYEFQAFDVLKEGYLVFYFKNQRTGDIVTGFPVDPKTRSSWLEGAASGAANFMLEAGLRRGFGRAVLGEEEEKFEDIDKARIDQPGASSAGSWAAFIATLGLGAGRMKLTTLATSVTARQAVTRLVAIRLFAKSIASRLSAIKDVLTIGRQAEASALRSSPSIYYSFRELKELIRASGLSGHSVGFEAHHLVEKRFAEKLGIAEDEIISVALTPRWHRNVRGFGANLDYQIVGELKRLGTTPEAASLTQIWQAHKAVYFRLGQVDWAQAIYEAYFKSRGIPY
jgi:RHS repeat-associated protein